MASVALLAGAVAAAADETGWRQPGVRVWYVGASASYSGQSDVEEAYLIDRVDGGGLRIVNHSAVGFWEAPLPENVLSAPDPAREGPFWISPQRLRALRPPDAFSWQGLSLVVKARVTYQSADDLPFIAFLPVQALYRAQAPRELITLTGENDGVVGDYFFDVETGLGLSSTLAVPGFYIVRMLSEINYDFAMRQAFAEDDGPHTAYRARQMAGRVAYPVNQFYLFEERVVSRYGASVQADLTLALNNIGTGQSLVANLESVFDGETRQFRVRPITGFEGTATAEPSAAAWTANGTHGFYWVPPGDFARDAIRVWDLDLTRRAPAGGNAVFEADGPPSAGWAPTRLELDPQGFVREMTVAAPGMSFEVDSRTATPPSKLIEVTGRAYYQETMGRAVPGPPDERDLGIMKMMVPKRVRLKGPPVRKTVSVRVQNHGARPEVVPDANALAALVTLEVESLGTCPAPAATIIAPTAFPITLAPRKTRKIVFAVDFDCANDPLATTKKSAHSDYRYTARLHVAADADAHDDACPHDPPPNRVDPTDPRIKDKGCGGKMPGRIRGADLFTDVVVK